MINYLELEGAVPSYYACSSCGTSGVKLWRPYNSFKVVLLCCDCAGEEQGKQKEVALINDRGFIPVMEYHDFSDTIGWLVPAVPVEGNAETENSYWGYTSVPEEGVLWWRSLPNRKANKEVEEL